jgi:predicted NAD/FAD-dependent oxidoreductase
MLPILIVGAGIAGLAAAVELHRRHVPFLLVDEAPILGGRFAPKGGDGWSSDPAVPWITTDDVSVLDLIRAAGLEADLVAVQGPIIRQRRGHPDSIVEGSFVTLRGGFGSLFEAWRPELQRPILSTSIAALRWISDRRLFLFRDGRTGATLSHPVTRRRIEASGVVVALPPGRARNMASQSRVLALMVEMLDGISIQRHGAGIFVVPRVDVPWAALQLEDHDSLSLVVREEAKGPERVPVGKSVLVATGKADVANSPRKVDAFAKLLYDDLRGIIPGLPAEPEETLSSVWDVAGSTTERLDPMALPTEPREAPVAIAGEAFVSGPESLHERLAISGLNAARIVMAKLGIH